MPSTMKSRQLKPYNSGKDIERGNRERWFTNYNALKAYILERGHLPDKHVVENRVLLSWAKYQRKKLKEGALDDEKKRLFEELMQQRATEHTGGRKKRVDN